MDDLVSIVIPIYNAEKSILSSINSILLQDYENIEVILVDDGSRDNSLQICESIAETDSRVKVIHTQNQGSGPARNTGIESSSGRFAYFPDADDILAPNAISIMVQAMKCNEVDLVVFGFKQVDSKGRVKNQKEYKDATFEAEVLRKDYSKCMGYTSEWGIQGAPWNKLFDLSVIKNNKIEYPSLRRHQDEGFIGRYMCYAKRVHFIPDVLYTYYINDLKKEWQKYPVDYIDAVIGLYETRKETILKWNKEDIITRDMIEKEYICNVIKSMELSFSPKMNFSEADRKEWIKQAIDKSTIGEKVFPKRFNMLYPKMCLSLIRSKHLNAFYYLMKAKVRVESKIRH